MQRLHWAFRFAVFLRAGLATMALAFLLPGCGGGGSDDMAPVAQALAEPVRQAPLAAPQIPDANALFDWAESRFAGYFPGPKATLTFGIYAYRFYPETGIYLAVAGQNVYLLLPSGQLLPVGAVADFACQVYPASCVAGASSLSGKTLYETSLGSAGYACRDCHGTTPGVNGITDILKSAGTQDSQGIPSIIRAAINNNECCVNGVGMGQFSAVTDAQLADIAAYVNATRWNKPLQ
jgi:mono/diheme cytochrome c family protein